MERGFNRVYDRNFVVGMREALRVRRDLGWVGRPVIPQGASVRTADELVTAPMAGYPDAEAYYADCSSAPLARGGAPSRRPVRRRRPVHRRRGPHRRDSGPRMLVHVEPTGGHLAT